MKVISDKNLPARLPVLAAIVWWLFLDRLGAPGWVYGVMGCLLGLGLIFEVVKLVQQKTVDIFTKAP